MSKNHVKEFISRGNNQYDVVFAADDEDVPATIPYSLNGSSILYWNDEQVYLIDESIIKGLLDKNNFDVDSSNGTHIFSNGRTGGTLKFYSGDYAFSNGNDSFWHHLQLFSNGDIYCLDGFNSPYCRLFIRKSSSPEVLDLSNVSFRYCGAVSLYIGASGAPFLGYGYFPDSTIPGKSISSYSLTKINNNQYFDSWNGSFNIITTALQPNGYYLHTEHALPGLDYEVNGTGGITFDTNNSPMLDINTQGGSGTFTVKRNGESLLSFTFNRNACLTKGTLLTLADGSKKAVENITYDDEVRVWNFDKGCYDTAKFLFISQPGLKHDHYIKLTFSDGTILSVTGKNSHHHVYNYTDRFFQGVNKMEPGTEVFTENGVVTLVSKEWIDEEVEYYNFITEEHINCFANGVLTSSHYGNIYPIDENMKFVKGGRKKVPYSEFKKLGISREWYNELRLGEQPDSLDVLKKYVDKVQSYQLEKPAPTFWQKLKTWWKSIFG